MSEQLTGNQEDELDIVEVDEIPQGAQESKVEEDDADKDDADDGDDRDADGDDEDEGDARLSEKGEDEEPPRERKRAWKRLTPAERKARRREGRDRTLSELAELRAWKAQTEAKLAALEGNVVSANEAQIDNRLEKAKDDLALAERILAAAMEANRPDDFTTALRIRDEAKLAIDELTRVKATIGKPAAPPSGPDPMVLHLSGEWKAANASWYNRNPEATRIANEIDAQVLAEGYNPATPAYWAELTRRVQDTFSYMRERQPSTPRKRPPPQGAKREHTSGTSKKEVYVTPERKQAMIDAGIWDDPVRRARVLKAYAEQDRNDRQAR